MIRSVYTKWTPTGVHFRGTIQADTRREITAYRVFLPVFKGLLSDDSILIFLSQIASFFALRQHPTIIGGCLSDR